MSGIASGRLAYLSGLKSLSDVGKLIAGLGARSNIVLVGAGVGAGLGWGRSNFYWDQSEKREPLPAVSPLWMNNYEPGGGGERCVYIWYKFGLNDYPCNHRSAEHVCQYPRGSPSLPALGIDEMALALLTDCPRFQEPEEGMATATYSDPIYHSVGSLFNRFLTYRFQYLNPRALGAESGL